RQVAVRNEFDRVIEEEKRINKVGYALMRALSDDVLRKVIEYQNDPVRMWSKLVSNYESATVANRVALREQLHNCILKKDEKIDDYVARLTRIRLALTDINESPTESDMIYTLLKGVKTKYKSLVESIKVSIDVNKQHKFTFDQ